MFICLGPEESIVRYGRLMSVCRDDDNSTFAFSAASLTRCNAMLSLVRSTPAEENQSMIINFDVFDYKGVVTRQWLLTLIFFELCDQVIQKGVVEVFSPKEGVAIG